MAILHGRLLVEGTVSPGVTSELRRIISAVTTFPNDQPDFVDEIRLRATRKTAEVLLSDIDNTA